MQELEAFNPEDAAGWAKVIMGDFEHPKYSVIPVIYFVNKTLSNIQKPSVVYAVYNEDEKGWEIGYSNEKAFNVEFSKLGDVVKYKYTPIEYEEAYINSKTNVLRGK